MNCRGNASIIAAVVAAGVIASATFFSRMMLVESRRKSIALQRTILANAYNSELLEYFRSMQPGRIADYLKANPATGSTLPPDLPKFCEMQNLMDRNTKSVTNPDPLAQLSANPLKDSNRFYQLQIINLANMSVNSANCNKNINQVTIGLTETFMISAGVSWVDPVSHKVQQVNSTVVLPPPA